VASSDKKVPGQPEASPDVKVSRWAPFQHRSFALLWLATVVSNVGGWMYSAASSWLMTSLDAKPLTVSLVQAADALPMFLFAVPAGALADIIDKRRFIIVLEILITLVSAIFAVLVSADLVSPATLLLFTFLISVFAALEAPAWQSIVPQLVPKEDLAPAIAANSVGINISRAIGPAIGGVIIIAFGIAAPFWLNAISNLGVIGVLLWWRSPQKHMDSMPAERFASAIRTGFRYARHNRYLRATLVRAVGFFLFASAYWALLPLVARNQIAGGPELYGALLGAIGIGAVGGAFVLPWLKARIGVDMLVAAGEIGTAVTLVLFGLAREPILALSASLTAGVSWIAVLASLNISAQYSLPDWVRGRGLATYVAVFFGTLTIRSVLWGQVAGMLGLPLTHFIAAGGALLAIPTTWRWKLHAGRGPDLTPSMHWPMPIVARRVEDDRGPVLVTVEYRIAPGDRDAFLTVLERLAHERRRDGAYSWGVFEDAAEEGRFLETFFVESWLEHLRQHKRVTKADRVLQERMHRFVRGKPKVTHLIAAEPARELAETGRQQDHAGL
jgi:MFS family permease/quinol monooxygenase YgiN